MAGASPIDPDLVAAFRRRVRETIGREIAEERARAEALRAVVVPRVEQSVAEARAQGLCGRAWLFGSFAWGLPGERSDVDVLFEGAAIDECASRVGRASGRMVHAIELDRAPESLRERVLAQGKPL